MTSRLEISRTCSLVLSLMSSAVVALLLIVLAPAAALSAPHVVAESGDARASAFDLSPYFNTAADADIFNSTLTPHASVTTTADAFDDVDWFFFTALAGSTVDVDLDCGAACGGFVDSVMALFDETGTLIAHGDDSDLDPGSHEPLDSYIGTYTLPAFGTYYVAVSNFSNFSNAIDSGTASALTRPDAASGGYSETGATIGDDAFTGTGGYSSGDYIVHVSVSLPVSAAPVPGLESWALWLTLLSIAAAAVVWIPRRG